MRLSVLDDGHRRRVKLFLALTATTSRVESPDIVKMLLYRPGFLSGPLLELTADAMRGPSYWTAGEREYLAMCTAQSHQCPFCIDTHAELTRIAGHGDIDPDDPASVRPELRGVRDFLATLTRTPDNADPTGIAGLPEHAVLEALRVNLVFNIVNRLANAFGFTLREGQLHSGTRALHRFGYRFPGFLLADGKPPATAMSWRGCAMPYSSRPRRPTRRCARPPRPAARFRNPGSPTPRPYATPHTGSRTPTSTASPPPGTPRTRSSNCPARRRPARRCAASTPAVAYSATR
jgi:AhpD family alkylhydroperoxidase